VFNFIKSLIKPNPESKLRKAISKKYKEAVQLQRNGKLRDFANVMSEIEELEKQLEEAINEDR
jgi:cell fate (sporulation/competence/biofilm development) regulator YmcA (YheA/YmcA/DUF963 family)